MSFCPVFYVLCGETASFLEDWLKIPGTSMVARAEVSGYYLSWAVFLLSSSRRFALALHYECSLVSAKEVESWRDALVPLKLGSSCYNIRVS